MKTRNGFVSNSSSSSFIIAIRKQGIKKLTKPCSCCGITHIHLLSFIQECYKDYGNSECSEIVADTKERIINKWKEDLGYSSLSEEAKVERIEYLENKISKYNEKKWDVAWIQIGYHDAILNTLWGDMVKNKTIEIIEDLQ